MNPNPPEPVNRRGFLGKAARVLAMTGVGALLGKLAGATAAKETVWQIDPSKCIYCGKCARCCVLDQSAVKCVHAYAICGYCELCTGYFGPTPTELNTAAENQACPTAAIKRTFVDDPYYEYAIDEKLCIGCAKCVAGCTSYGNGSLFLQIRHDICLHCNECAIARVCPGDAFVRVPADKPYLIKTTPTTS